MLSFDEPQEGEERQSLLDTFREDGIGAGLAQGLGMVIPQSAQSGGAGGIGDIFSDFVEFSTIGDVKDVVSGLDTSNDLDPLERGMSLLPILGFAGVATGTVATAVHGNRARAARAQARTAAMIKKNQRLNQLQGDVTQMASTLGPDGPSWKPANPANVELDPDSFDVDGPERRQFAAELEQFAVEQVAREGSYAPMHAGDFNELVAVVNEQYRKSAGASHALPQEGLEPALRTLGAKLVENSPEGTYSNQTEYGQPATIEEQQFVAAQWAITRFMQGAEQGILKWSDTNEVTNLDNFLSALDGRVGPRDQAKALDMLINLETKMMKMSQGPDWTPTPHTRIETAYMDAETGESRVFMAVDSRLLPDERVMDMDNLTPYDRNKLNDRNIALNEDTLVSDMAANLIVTYLEEKRANPQRLEDSKTWYRRQNKVVEYMSEQTGHSVERVAAYYAVLSQVTKWVPDNVVGATHMLLEHTRPDLVPGSPEYKAVFVEAMKIGGWGEVMLQYTSKSTIEAHGLDANSVLEHWADPENAKTKTGKMRGVESAVKQESLEMLNAGVPWQLFLRTSKYHNFAHGMINPDIADIATIDTHSNNATMGMIYIGLLGSQGQKSIKMSTLREGNSWSPEGYGTEMEIDLEMLDDAERIMREDMNMSEDRIATVISRFRKVPSDQAEMRYRAQQKAHLIARDYLGLDAGHEVQAPTWIPIQERKLQIAAIRKSIKDRAGKGNQRAYGAVWDSTVLHHMEGNPRWMQGVVGMTATAAPDVKAPPPPGVLKNADDIHLEPNRDGTVTVWASRTATNRRVLRHLRPTGPTIDGMRQWVPRQAKKVRHAKQHVAMMTEQVGADGLPIPQQVRTYAGNQHVAERPGNWMVFEFADQAAARKFEQRLGELEHPFALEQQPIHAADSGLSRQKLTQRQLLSFGDKLTSATESPFVTNDWVAISAFTGKSYDLRSHHRLGESLRKKGYHPIEANSAYQGGSEKSWIVFGMPYEEAHAIGNSKQQDSVMTREGLIYHDGTHEASGQQVIVGSEALQQDNYTEVTIGGRRVAFSMEIEPGRTEVGEGINSLHGRSGRQGARTQVQVNLGGVEAGVPTQHTDAVWNLAERAEGVVSKAAYVHGGLWKPAGTMRAVEHVFTDGAQVGSVRLASDVDTTAGSQFDVYVPEHEWRQLGNETNPAGKARRTMAQAMELRVEDLENNQIHIDGDVTLQYPPDAEIRAGGNQARILGLKINGEAPKTALIDVQADVPMIMLGEAGYQQGLVEVKLSNGRVTSIMAWNEGDLWKADEALAAAGVTVSQMRMSHATIGPPDITKKIEFVPSGSTQVETAGSSPAVTYAGPQAKKRDLELMDDMEGWLDGDTVQLNLGNRVAPTQAKAVQETVLGLFSESHPKFKAFTDQYGALPKTLMTDAGEGVVVSRFKKGEGVDTAGMTDQQRAEAEAQNAYAIGGFTTVKAPRTFFGVYLNESVVVRDQMHDGKFGDILHDLMEYPNASARPGVNIVEGTLVHELAHTVDDRVQFYGLEAEFTRRVKRTMNELGGDALSIASELSLYATENTHEFYAEAFTEVVYNPDAHPALKALVKDIQEGIQLLEIGSRSADDIAAIVNVWTGVSE